MKQNSYLIPRRHFLRGLGACLALPALEIMTPALSYAKEKAKEPNPLRLGVLYKGNGVQPTAWDVSGTETDFTLSPLLQPLKNNKKDLIVLSNLGIADSQIHDFCTSHFMNGHHNKHLKTFDQVIADHVGHATQFKSIQLSAEPLAIRGTPDYNYLASDAKGKALYVERNEQQAFNTLFRGGSNKKMTAKNLSVLDAVQDHSRILLKKASQRDKETLTNYMEYIREVEISLKRQNSGSYQRKNMSDIKMPGFNESFEGRMKVMLDLMALAFWTDATRVISMVMAREVSRRFHGFLEGVTGHHNASHFIRQGAHYHEFNKITLWYVTQFNNFINKMKSLKEPDGSSVLDHSVLLFGSGIKHGDYHTRNDLPLILAGGAGGQLKTGRWLVTDKQKGSKHLFEAC